MCPAVVMELKLKALVLDSVHNIEIVRGLQGEKIQNVASWSWQKQLRFYLRESKREREREREGGGEREGGERGFPYLYFVYSQICVKCLWLMHNSTTHTSTKGMPLNWSTLR